MDGVRLGPGVTPEHTLTAKEVFAVVEGIEIFQSRQQQEVVKAGDAIIVSLGNRISFRVEEGQFLEAICAMPVGDGDHDERHFRCFSATMDCIRLGFNRSMQRAVPT